MPSSDEYGGSWNSARDGRLLTLIRHLVTAIAAASFLVTLLATLGGLAVRQLGVRGYEWTFELAAISFVWTSFFGVLLAEIRRENVAFTVIADLLRGPVGNALALVSTLIVLVLAIALLDSGLAFLERSGASPTPVMRLPRIVQIFPFVCFAACLCIILLVRLVDVVREWIR